MGGYRFTVLTPARAREIAKALAAGVPRKALADEYGVTLRTIDRARERARQPSAVVRVEGWWAEFVLTDEGPVRVTPWSAA